MRYRLRGGLGVACTVLGGDGTSPQPRNLDRSFSRHGLAECQSRVGSEISDKDIPVFIMTCVVARLTFFLKPRRWCQHDSGCFGVWRILPAHDIIAAASVLFLCRGLWE